MRALGLLAVTVPADDPDDARRWWSQELGLPVSEDDPAVLDLGEVTLSFGPALQVRVVAAELPSPVRLVDPVGTVVDVVPPDLESARQAEETIRDFVAAAASLTGRSVDELADDVAAIALEARDRIADLLADVANNKVLATQLALGQRAREAATATDIPWHLHAASTLVSGLVGPGGPG
jgi:catechol 2,3-dioxygenase-like lactoylglutathione lyase family enzyme